MRSDDLQDHLRRIPFQPLRLTLTDGTTYLVHHPEMVMVCRSSFVVGIPRTGDTRPIYDRTVTVSLLHLVQIEPLEPASSSS